MSLAPTPQVLPAGVDGFLIRFALRPDPQAMAAAQVMARQLETDTPDGAVEVAPALVSVLLRFDPARVDRDDLARSLAARARAIADRAPDAPDALRRWTIPAAFGGEYGPDLADVADRLGLSQQQAIDQLCNTDLHVLTIGFAPGQPYIGLLPEAWNLPRMADLNPRVPAGAVVVAVRQIVMFGAESATGWRQVACSGFRTFVPDRNPPMPLRAGDAIRYRPVTGDEMQSLSSAADGLGGAVLEALE